jgi:hypothetical protein
MIFSFYFVVGRGYSIEGSIPLIHRRLIHGPDDRDSSRAVDTMMDLLKLECYHDWQRAQIRGLILKPLPRGH